MNNRFRGLSTRGKASGNSISRNKNSRRPYCCPVPRGLKACVEHRKVDPKQQQHVFPANERGKSVFLEDETPEALVRAALAEELHRMPSREQDSQKGSTAIRFDCGRVVGEAVHPRYPGIYSASGLCIVYFHTRNTYKAYPYAI